MKVLGPKGAKKYFPIRSRGPSLASFIYRTTPTFPASHVIAHVFFKTPLRKKESKIILARKAFFSHLCTRSDLVAFIRQARKELTRVAREYINKGYEPYLAIWAYYGPAHPDELKHYKHIDIKEVGV